jgi:hypothetical protein
MTSFASRPRLLSATFAAILGAAVIAGCSAGAARADDDTDGAEPTLLDTQVLQYVLKGLGCRRGDEEKGIEYRERSPLVLPPNNQLTVLPSPEDVANSKKAANWPDDPDLKRVRVRREQERKRKPVNPGVDDEPLSPSQMTEGKATVGPTTPRGGEAPGKSAEGSAQPSTNAELGSKGFMNIFKTGFWAPKEEYVPFTGEPQRSSLIEPPPGYRTPSPSQPYGVGREKWKAPTIDKNEPVK